MIGISQIQSSESAATWISFLIDATPFTDPPSQRRRRLTFTIHFTGCQSISNSIPFLMYPFHFHVMSHVSYSASWGSCCSSVDRYSEWMVVQFPYFAILPILVQDSGAHSATMKYINLSKVSRPSGRMRWRRSDVKKPFKRPINCLLTINNRPSVWAASDRRINSKGGRQDERERGRGFRYTSALSQVMDINEEHSTAHYGWTSDVQCPVLSFQTYLVHNILLWMTSNINALIILL